MRAAGIAGLCAAMVFAGGAFARAVVDGRLQVEPAKDNRYIVDSSTVGKAELFGYVGDFVDTKKIAGIVLTRGERATDEQKHIIAITASAQHLEAFIDLDGEIKPLVDPTAPVAAPAAPALDEQMPVAH